MVEAQLIGRHISEFAGLIGFPVIVPDRPPEGDPEFGLERYIEHQHLGFSIVVDWNDVATCVQFFSEDSEPGYQRYLGPLPRGLNFGSSRAEVRHVMGSPACSSDGGPEVFGIKHRPWDWFVFEGRKAHFEYEETCDALRMVSIMLLPPKL